MKTITTIVIIATVAIFCAAAFAFAADIDAGVTGKINHDSHSQGQSGMCYFSAFPRNVEEFKAMQAKVATEPQGAVAMILVAMKLYGDNEAEGKKCLELSLLKLYWPDLQRIKDKVRASAGDTYGQKFLPLAFLKGATPENGYAPSEPYTVEVSVNNGRPYSKLSSANAPVIYLNIKTNGTDSGTRPIEVIRPSGAKYFVVNNTAGITSQVKFPIK